MRASDVMPGTSKLDPWRVGLEDHGTQQAIMKNDGGTVRFVKQTRALREGSETEYGKQAEGWQRPGRSWLHRPRTLIPPEGGQRP